MAMVQRVVSYQLARWRFRPAVNPFLYGSLRFGKCEGIAYEFLDSGLVLCIA